MAEEAVAMGANTFQFFTRSPRGGHAKEWSQKDLDEYKAYAAGHGIGQIVAYAPYTANAASEKMAQGDFARLVFSEDLSRMEALPGNFYAAHPGSAVGESEQMGEEHAAEVINEVLTAQQKTMFLVITTSGRGTEIASTFESLAKLLGAIKLQDHVGVCFDVCGVWGAGYDVKHDLDGVLDEFDKTVGLDRIKVVHLADPEYDLGTHHDHHKPLGEGMLGQEALEAIVKCPRLANKIFILETPHDDLGLFTKEISELRRCALGA